MYQIERNRAIPAAVGTILVLVLAILLFFRPKIYEKGEIFLENASYDLQFRHTYKPVSKDIPIVIIDIDDRSLSQEGRWPWPRNKIADLVTKLFQKGVSIIAFDITFSEPEKNKA